MLLYGLYQLLLLNYLLQSLPLPFRQYIIASRIHLLTKTRIPDVEYGIVVNMPGPNDIGAALFLHAVIQHVKLYSGLALFA